jgi:hypothetical protein
MKRGPQARPYNPNAVRTLEETAREYERRTGERMTEKIASQIELRALRKLREKLDNIPKED